ncbi:MAG: outer membrane protein assembly factor BamB [Halorhodospira halophila]|uniref:outer membrane protein assembly factor BamB n=1 Tax=Halorhodospira TaxID=85108 RepID=UPI00191151E2|nr:outer membrane protein assembly factor BamB [Halorhodospira halophila]MCG5537047.1 outer membrane protein assembly factor BamB [Halorhodospira sp. 9622]MCG5540973.1 outer membrane protein assembly factor BamB [Halorhodospira sp. M39old]MCG5542348.1 outer membrane protein assembly factor BamB [Halorhodospira sp. 9628]MCG5545333.1 outer membrane protein assembly factor BamB [Halorhodospira sp. M38]MBK5936245.1 outer membrane protein assembly factor BamB [Halorhodospira halophila]
MIRAGLRSIGVAAVLGMAAGCALQDPLPNPQVEATDTLDVELVWSGRPVGSLESGAFALEPAYADGVLYVADARGWVRALDAETREGLWHDRLNRPLSAGPVVAGDRLLVGDRKGRVYAYERDSGEPAWMTGLSAQVLASPRYTRGMVVARSADGRIYGLDAEDGSRQWIFDRSIPALTLRRNSAPAVSGGTAVVGLQNGRLVALNVADGSVRWEHTLTEPRGRTELERMSDIAADPVIHRGAAYAVAYQGAIGSVRIANGAQAWSRDVASHRGLVAQGEEVYLAADDGRVWAFDRRNGATAWRQEALEGLALTRPVVHEGYLVMGDDAGHVNWLRLRDGELVARERLSDVPLERPPVVTGDGDVYVLDARGRMTALRLH